MRLQLLTLLACTCVLSTACAADKINVVSFSTVLTEIAEKVGGTHVKVNGLVKPGVDPHDFEPKPSDMKMVENASVVLLSAKHMEGYVTKLKGSGTRGTWWRSATTFPRFT